MKKRIVSLPLKKRIVSLLLFATMLITLTVPASYAWNGTDPGTHHAAGIGNLYDYDYDNYVPTDWQADIWRPVGVGGGGGVFLPRFSPLDPNLWFAICDMGGAYVSQDAGYTWAMLNFGGTNTVGTGFFFDLNDENVVYAAIANAALWKTTDKGSNWTRIFPHEDRSFTYHRTDHADVWYAPIPGECDKPGCTHENGGRTLENPGDEIPGTLPGANMAKDMVGFPACDPPDGFPYNGSVTFMAIDPTDSNKLYVIVTQLRGSRGGSSVRDHLYYSEDGGESFTQIANDITTYNASAGAPFNLPNFNITTQTRAVTSMIVEPTTGDALIFVGNTAVGANGAIRYTSGGDRVTVPAMQYGGTSLGAIAQAEFLWDGEEIIYYFRASNYIYKTKDMVNFERLLRGTATLPNTGVQAGVTGGVAVSNFDVSSEDVIWYNNGQNVYRSVDGGANWSHVWRGIGSRGNTATDINRWAGFGDEFTYWQDYAVQFGTGWSTGMENQPRGSQADPGVYGGGNNGYLIVTRNGGELWGAPHTHIVHGYDDKGYRIDTFVSTGFNVTTTYGVHFDPFNPKHCFMTITDVGLFQSWDGGYSWRHSGISGMFPAAYRPYGVNAQGQSINDFAGNIGSGDGDSPTWGNTCYWLAFDPLIKDRVYGAWSGVHDCARLRYFPLRDTNSESGVGGVAISDDGGRTWKRVVGAGLPTNIIPMHIEVGPVNAEANTVTLYIATHGKGFFKSSDSGASWKQINNGVSPVTHKYDEGKTPGSGAAYDAAHPNSRYFGRKIVWVDDGTPDGVVYGMIARSGAEFVGEQTGQLYRSVDGGESWVKCAMPKNTGMRNPANYVSDLAYDPRNPSTIYAACWQSSNGAPSYLMVDDLETEGLPNSGGVFISHDSGDSWSPIWGPNRHVYGIQVDPFNPNNVFAVTFEGQMMVLQYEGASSSLYSGEGYDAGYWDIHQEYGFNFRQASSPFIDVNHPDFVFVSSFGGNIWRGPSHVDPKLGALSVCGVDVEVDPNVYLYAVTVDKDVGTADIAATGVYDTAAVDVAGDTELAYGDNLFEITVTNELGTVSGIYTLNVIRGAAPAATASVRAANDPADVKLPVEFDVSLSGKNVVTVELEFAVDSGLLEMAYTEALAGFSAMDSGGGGIKWSIADDGKAVGKMTLVCQSPGDSLGFTSEELEDIVRLFFAAKTTGLAVVELTGFRAYGPEEAGGVVKELNAEIGGASAETSVIIVYSPYDLNKDGVVDARDLSIAALYCQFNSQDSGWDTFVKTIDSFGAGITASMCDFNGDGEVNMLDLVELYLNYGS